MPEQHSAADASEMLVANLAVIDRVIAFVCRRRALDRDASEEFAAVVRLKLVENDYAILRKYEGRSSFATYMTVVVQRLLLDYQIHLWGKWHPSAEAKRMGGRAVEIEKLLRRDGRSVDEAFAILRGSDAEVTRESVEEIASRLPPRPQRPQTVELDEARAVEANDIDAGHAERRHLSERVSRIVREFINGLPKDDRLVLQLRFDSGMTVAEIARSLRIDQRALYRNIEKRLRELRAILEREGVEQDAIGELVRDRGVVLDFRLDRPEREATP